MRQGRYRSSKLVNGLQKGPLRTVYIGVISRRILFSRKGEGRGTEDWVVVREGR